MSEEWDLARLQNLIDDHVEEHQKLEYKSAALVEKGNYQKDLSIAVSAMANAAGGTVILGIAEYQERSKQHLPEKLDPLDVTKFSKETLENILRDNIHPPVDGVEIFPISTDPEGNHAIYAIQVPQGITAHQAKDRLYYARRNFKKDPMFDHEIRDVMARGRFPNIELDFAITTETRPVRSSLDAILGAPVDYVSPKSGNDQVSSLILEISGTNVGYVYAEYVMIIVSLPVFLVSDIYEGYSIPDIEIIDGKRFFAKSDDNTIQDRNGDLFRFYPILPGLTRIWQWEFVKLLDKLGGRNNIAEVLEDEFLYWSVFADNAPKKSGMIAFRDIPTTCKD